MPSYKFGPIANVKSLLRLSEQSDYNPDDMESNDFTDDDFSDDLLDDIIGDEKKPSRPEKDPEELVTLTALDDDEEDGNQLYQDISSIDDDLDADPDVDLLSSRDAKEAIASVKAMVSDISTMSPDDLEDILTREIQSDRLVTPEEAKFEASRLVSQTVNSTEMPDNVAAAVNRVMNRVNVLVSTSQEDSTADAILQMEKKAEAKRQEEQDEYELRKSSGEDVPIPGTIGDYIQKGRNPYDDSITFGKEIRSAKVEELAFGKQLNKKGAVSQDDRGLLSIINNELFNAIKSADKGSVIRMFQSAYADNMFFMEGLLSAHKQPSGKYVYSSEALEDRIDQFDWSYETLKRVAYYPTFSRVLIQYYNKDTKSFSNLPPLDDIISQIEGSFPKSIKFNDSILFDLLPNEMKCLTDEDSAIEAMVNDVDNLYALYNAVVSPNDVDVIGDYSFNVRSGRSRFADSSLENSMRASYVEAIKRFKNNSSNIEALNKYIANTVGDIVFGYGRSPNLDEILSMDSDYTYEEFVLDFRGESEQISSGGNPLQKVVIKRFGLNPDNIDKPVTGQKAEPITQETQQRKFPTGYRHGGIGELKFLKMKYRDSGLWDAFINRCMELHDRYVGSTPGVFDDRYTLKASGGLSRKYMQDFCSNLIRQMDNDEDRKKLIVHMLRSARAAARFSNGDMIKEDIILLERLGVGSKTAKRIVMTQFAIGPNRRSILRDDNGDPIIDDKGRIKLKSLGRSDVLSLDYLGPEDESGNQANAESLLSEIDSSGLEFVTNSQWGKMRSFTEEVETNSVADALYKELRRRRNAPTLSSKNLLSFYNSLSTKVKKAIIAEPVFTPLELARRVPTPDGTVCTGYVFDRDLEDPSSSQYKKIQSVIPFDIRNSKVPDGIPTGKPIDHDAIANKLSNLKTISDLDSAIVLEPPFKVTWLLFTFMIMRRRYKLRSTRSTSDIPTNVLTKELFGSKDYRDEFTGGFDFGSGERFLSINIPFINLLHEIFAFYSGMRRSIFNSIKSSSKINPAGVPIYNPKSPKDVNPDIRTLTKMVLGGRGWCSELSSAQRDTLISEADEYFSWAIDRPNLRLISMRSLDKSNKDHQKIILDTHDLQKYYSGQQTLISEFELSSLTELLIMLFGDTPIDSIINFKGSRVRARYLDRFYNGDSSEDPPIECLSDRIRRITIDMGIIDRGSYLGYFDPIGASDDTIKKFSKFLREAREKDDVLLSEANKNLENLFGDNSVVKKALKKASDIADLPENSKEEISLKNRAMRLIGMSFDQSTSSYKLGVRVYNSKSLEFDTSYEYSSAERIADMLNSSGYQCAVIGSPTYLYDPKRIFGRAYSSVSSLYSELEDLKTKLKKVTSKPGELKKQRKEIIERITKNLSGLMIAESARQIKGRPDYVKFVIKWKAPVKDIQTSSNKNITQYSLSQDKDWEEHIKTTPEYYASTTKTITSDTGESVIVPASTRVVTINVPIILRSKHIPKTDYPSSVDVSSSTPDGQLPFYPNYWSDDYTLKDVRKSETLVIRDQKYYNPPTYFGGLVNITPPGTKTPAKVPSKCPPLTFGIIIRNNEKIFLPAIKKVTYKFNYSGPVGDEVKDGSVVTYLVSDNGNVIELPCKNVITFVGATLDSPSLNITPSSVHPDSLKVVDDYGNESPVELVSSDRVGYISSSDPTKTPMPVVVNPELDENGKPVSQPTYDPLSMAQGRKLFMDYFEYELHNPRNIRVQEKVEGNRKVSYYTAFIRPYSIKDGGLKDYMIAMLKHRRGLVSQLPGGYTSLKVDIEDVMSGERTAQMLRLLAQKIRPQPSLTYSGTRFKGWSDVEMDLPIFKLDTGDTRRAKPVILVPAKFGRFPNGEINPDSVEEWTDASPSDLPKSFRMIGYNVRRPIQRTSFDPAIKNDSENVFGYSRTTWTRSAFLSKDVELLPDKPFTQYRKKKTVTINPSEHEVKYKKPVSVKGIEQKDQKSGKITTIEYVEPVLAAYQPGTFVLADALESDIPVAIQRVIVSPDGKTTKLNIVFTGGPFSDKEHIERYNPDDDTRSPIDDESGDIYTGPYATKAHEPPPYPEMPITSPSYGKEVDVYLPPKVSYRASKTDVISGYSRSFDRYLPMMVQVARSSGKFTSVKHLVDRFGPLFIFKWRSVSPKSESNDSDTVLNAVQKLLQVIEDTNNG